MSNPEVTLGLSIVSLNHNLKPTSEVKDLEKQNRKTRHSQRPITAIKKLEIHETKDNIVSLRKVARNPHFIFIT